jgi:hypothetical protein
MTTVRKITELNVKLNEARHAGAQMATGRLRLFGALLVSLLSLLGAGCSDNSGNSRPDGSVDGRKKDGQWTDFNAQAEDGGAREAAVVTESGTQKDSGVVKTEGGAVKTEGGAVKTEGGTVKTEGGAVKTEGGAVKTEGGAVKTEGGTVVTDGGSVVKTEGGTVIILDGGGTAQKDAPVALPDAPKKDVPVDFKFGEGKDSATDFPKIDAAVAADGAKTPDAPGNFDGLVSVVDTGIGKSESGVCLCMRSTGTGPCECNDGVDNDGDGLTDYPNDPQCGSPCDNSEAVKPQCSDGIDNDGDGLIDAADPDCTGPYDNDESTLGTNIPGDNIDCQEDCFFDGNSGQGNDKCSWNVGCDPLNPAPYLPCPKCKCTYDPKLIGTKKCPATQVAQCKQVCLPLTPNGCDCFGCCQITKGTLTRIVKLSTNCTYANLADTTKCASCTQVADCLNTCGKCDYCMGKKPDPSCYPDTGVPWPKDTGTGEKWPFDAAAPVYDAPPPDHWIHDAPPPDQPVWPFDAKAPDGWVNPFCPPGEIVCGSDPFLCPDGTWCITGCCVKF